MDPTDYVFHIDAFTPDTLPMGRFAEYVAQLAKLLGHAEHTHFVRLDSGSAQIVHRVDAVDAFKVETRLNGVRLGDAAKDALAAHRALDELLLNDNAVGTLTEVASSRVVVPFAGRNRPKSLGFPSFRQDASIDGQIISIGGREDTAHAILQDGGVYHANISVKRDLARQMAKLLYGPVVRLHGRGRFERGSDGMWSMLDFRADSFETLDGRSLSEVMSTLREIAGNGLMKADAYQAVGELRGDTEL